MSNTPKQLKKIKDAAHQLLESLKAISIMLGDLEGVRELTSYEAGCLEIATKAIKKATE